MFRQRVRNGCFIFVAVCLTTAATTQPVQAQQGLGERLGQQLDQGLDRLGSELREGWASLRQSVDRMGIQGRVYGRLRWDKHIATAGIDVDTEEEGTVVLRGEVKSADAKQKAVQLANDTVGVKRVVDELTVATPAETP